MSVHHSVREYPVTSEPIGDTRRLRPVQRVVCGRCGAVEHLIVGREGRYPPHIVADKMHRRGWAIGKKAIDDRCPKCVSLEVEERRAAVKKPWSPKVVKDLREVGAVLEKVAVPPRVMSREDRRIIFAKIDEVYPDEKTGYVAGWSDERVAKDLNVPRAWVETIRDENFGALKSNAEVEAVSKEVADLNRDMEELRTALSGLTERMRTVEARTLPLITRVENIKKQMA